LDGWVFIARSLKVSRCFGRPIEFQQEMPTKFSRRNDRIWRLRQLDELRGSGFGRSCILSHCGGVGFPLFVRQCLILSRDDIYRLLGVAKTP